jgi:hypothetical protein
MSGPDAIDALVVARRITEATAPVSVTADEVFAMAGCLVGLDQQLDAADARPTVNARLAAAVALVLAHHEEYCRARNLLLSTPPDDTTSAIVDECQHTRLATHDALNTLKTIFETEFPK